ncbi:alpha/beta fold hydrolase [Nocardia thraciensis]
MPQTTVVLVPGNFTGAWMWTDTIALLQRADIRAIALELPTIGSLALDTDFYADARAVRAVLDALEPPVLLCGHSYGGGVITEAAAGPHPAVEHLVYLNGVVPDSGDTLVSLMTAAVLGAEADNRPDHGLRMRADGLAELTPEHARRVLFGDCPDERAEAGLVRLQPANVSGGTQPLTGAAWRELPATFVRCVEDVMPEAVAPAFFERDPEVVELPAGHSPQWSRPELLAELLTRLAKSLQP